MIFDQRCGCPKHDFIDSLLKPNSTQQQHTDSQLQQDQSSFALENQQAHQQQTALPYNCDNNESSYQGDNFLMSCGVSLQKQEEKVKSRSEIQDQKSKKDQSSDDPAKQIQISETITKDLPIKFIVKYRNEIDGIGLNENEFLHLLRHPSIYKRTNKNQNECPKPQDYYLQENTMIAFFNLLKRSPQAKQIVRLLPSALAKVEKTFKLSGASASFSSSEVEYQAQDSSLIANQISLKEHRFIILPWYQQWRNHWSFIIVDLLEGYRPKVGNLLTNHGNSYKVTMVDSVDKLQKQHRLRISSLISTKYPTWTQLVKKFIKCYTGKEANNCKFEVLDLKDQGNDYDCGLLVCLLIWQFFQTRETNDLLNFPWAPELSPQFRLSLGLALVKQNLISIEKFMQNVREITESNIEVE